MTPDLSDVPRLEPGYGWFRVLVGNRLLARKDFVCNSIEERDKLLFQLNNRKNLMHPNLLMLEEFGMVHGLEVYANFEFFEEKLTDAISQMKTDIKAFLKAAGQIINLWLFLEEKQLIFSNFCFSMIRIDVENGIIKIVDRLDRIEIDENHSVDFKTSRSFLAKMRGEEVTHLSSLMFALGLIAMAVFLDPEDFKKAKEAILNDKIENFEEIVTKYQNIHEVLQIKSAIGTDFIGKFELSSTSFSISSVLEDNVSVESCNNESKFRPPVPSKFFSKAIPEATITVTDIAEGENKNQDLEFSKKSPLYFSFHQKGDRNYEKPPKSKVKTFTHIDLLDVSGEPYMKEPYVIEAPDIKVETPSVEALEKSRKLVPAPSIEEKTESFEMIYGPRATVQTDQTGDYLVGMKQVKTILLDPAPLSIKIASQSIEESTVQKINFKSVAKNIGLKGLASASDANSLSRLNIRSLNMDNFGI